MPVYNEARFLPGALDALLAQDFSDFELIISDNGSADATPEICRDYASRDPRIRYHRNEVNLGAVANFRRAFELSCGEYFMWANGHALWAPDFISSCLEVLKQDPSLALCYTETTWIDTEGRVLGPGCPRLDTRGCPPLARFNLVIWMFSFIYGDPVYGLTRSSALRQLGRHKVNSGWDVLLVAKLALLGAFAQIPRPLMSYRVRRNTETPNECRRRTLEALDPGARSPFVLYARTLVELFRTVVWAPVNYVSKILLAGSLALWLSVRVLRRWAHY